MAERKRHEYKIPFPFILDYLFNVDIMIKPMFGCYGVYANGKLCLFLVHPEKPHDRPDGKPMPIGVYIATTTDQAALLRPIFPDAKFELLKEKKVWIFVSETNEEFEEYVIKACELISSQDIRIGR